MPFPGCSLCVRLCSSLHEWPAAVLCTVIALLQMSVLDYYLIHHLGTSHLTWLAFDAVNVTLLIISIHQARTAINQENRKAGIRRIASGSMGWVAWFFISLSVAAKSVVIFHFFSDDLDETADTFFGPNTLKTAIALGSCTFLLLLITQHDAPAGSEGRRYIEELTGTVAFDILDTVDILEVLFDSDDRARLWGGLEEFILVVAVLNLVLPTVPLFTLAKSKFGAKKLSVKLVHGHRILLVLAVNLPNLLIRMLLWHGISTGISPFTLKNILAILLTFYDIYEHNKEELQEEEEHNEGNKFSNASSPEPVEKYRFKSAKGELSSIASENGVDNPTHSPNLFLPRDTTSDMHRENDRNENPYKGESRKRNQNKGEPVSSNDSYTFDDKYGHFSNEPPYVNTTSV